MLNKIFKVVASNSMAQLVILLSTPFLAKLYGQEAFGLLGLLASVGAVAVTLSMLKLDLVLLMDNKKTQFSSYYTAILLLSTCVALITFSGLIFLYPDYGMVFILSLAVYIIGMSLFNVRLASFLATSKVNALGFITVLRAIFCVVLQFILYDFFEIYGLVVGVAISYFLFFDVFGVVKDFSLKKSRDIICCFI